MKKLKKEIRRYIISGFSALITDTLSYFILINFFSYNLSKGVSFLSGTIISFILNKYWTFEKKDKSFYEVLKFVTLYLSTFFVNVGTNSFFIEKINIVPLAFLIATSLSTVLNYVGQKFWVFK